MPGQPATAENVRNAGNAVDPTPQRTLLEQMGGFTGLISSTLPILVLVPVNNAYGLLPALGAALAVAFAVFVVRLIRRENLQPAFSGVIGVGIGAAIAWGTGDARGYFLYSIWVSLIFGVVAVLSVLVRWPAVGVVWKGVNGESMAWRENATARMSYTLATLGWAVVFFARFIVQNGFYHSEDTNALAVARILMGWPLTGIVTLFTFFMVKRASHAMKSAEHAEDAEPADNAELKELSP